MDDKEKFIVRITCEPKITPTDIGAEIVDKMLTLRVEKVNESVISQLRDLMKEKGINELIAIDESKVLEIVKKAQAFDIIRSHCDNSILEIRQRKNGQIIHYLVVGELGKYILSEEQYNLLEEVLL